MDLAHFAWSIRHFACLSGSAAFIVAGPADSIDWDVVLTCIPMALLGLIAHFPLAVDVLLALCAHAILYAIASRPKSQSLPKESEVIAHSSPGLVVLQRGCPSLSVPSLSFPKRASEGTQSTQSTAPSSDIEDGDESQSQQCDESSAVEIHYLIFDIKQRFAEDFLIVLLIIAVAVCQLHPHPPWTAISLTVGLSVGITIFFQRRSKETLITPRRVPVSMPLATLAASLLSGRRRFAEDFLIVLLIIAVAVCQLHPHPPWTAISLTLLSKTGVYCMQAQRSLINLRPPEAWRLRMMKARRNQSMKRWWTSNGIRWSPPHACYYQIRTILPRLVPKGDSLTMDQEAKFIITMGRNHFGVILENCIALAYRARSLRWPQAERFGILSTQGL